MLPPIKSGQFVQTNNAIDIPFYDSSRIMRIVAKALLALAVTTVVVSITLAAIINPLAAIALVGAAIFLAPGLYFQLKDYWNDDVEVARLSKQAHDMPFNKIVDRFGWHRTFNTLLIAPSTLNQKFLTYILKSKMSINDIEKKYKEYNEQYHFYTADQLKVLFNERFRTQSVKDLIKSVGGVNEVKKVFSEISEVVRDKYRSEASNLTLDQVIADYGWDIFDYFDDPTRFTDTIKHHVETHSLLETLNKYSTELVKKGVLDFRTEFFRKSFFEMAQMSTFTEILPHEELFNYRYGILDPYYLEKFHSLRRKFQEIQEDQYPRWRYNEIVRDEVNWPWKSFWLDILNPLPPLTADQINRIERMYQNPD